MVIHWMEWQRWNEMLFSVQMLKRSKRPNRKLNSRTSKCLYAVCISFGWYSYGIGYFARLLDTRCHVLHIVIPKNYKTSQTEKEKKKNELIFRLADYYLNVFLCVRQKIHWNDFDWVIPFGERITKCIKLKFHFKTFLKLEMAIRLSYSSAPIWQHNDMATCHPRSNNNSGIVQKML